MGSPRRGRKEATPLDAKQQALAEQQRKLREQMERLERLIQEAPQLAEEKEKRRREEIVARASRSSRRLDSPAALIDKRYDLQAVPGRRKSLRAERAEARLKFFVFCIILLGLLLWIYTKTFL